MRLANLSTQPQRTGKTAVQSPVLIGKALTTTRGQLVLLQVYYVPRLPLVLQVVAPTILGSFRLVRNIILRERITLVHAHQAFSALAHEAVLHARTMGCQVRSIVCCRLPLHGCSLGIISAHCCQLSCCRLPWHRAARLRLTDHDSAAGSHLGPAWRYQSLLDESLFAVGRLHRPLPAGLFRLQQRCDEQAASVHSG